MKRAPGPAAAFRVPLITALAAAVGLVAGWTAWCLYRLIGLISQLVFFQRWDWSLPSLQQHRLGAWVLVVPALGGLAVGLMARYGSSKIRGHGIPEAMEAVLVHRSRVAPRVAVLKPLSAAIAIGTGGPFGAEGPIIQTGGALGSLLGQILHTTAAERKVLLACGAAAGMAAIFSTPIAAVILAIELLLFEFKSRSFIPLTVASTVATAVHLRLMGRGPMFEVGAIDFGIPQALPWYALLGLICGLAAVGMSRALYLVEDLFERLPIAETGWPAIGGLGLGVIGFFFPRALGVGYDTTGDILNGRLGLTLLLAVLAWKTLALLVSLGSGTSGGLLAPMFMAGAALGGAYAMGLDRLLPGSPLVPAAFALVAMAAVFGAASRATFAFIIFAFEITRDYNAILPLMLACVIADAVALKLEPNSIMTEKLARRGVRVPHEYEPDVLHHVAVGEVMDRQPSTAPGEMTVGALAARLADHDPVLSRRQALPLVDAAGRLCGLITRGDLVRALQEGREQSMLVEVGSVDLEVAFADEPLRVAVERMLRRGVGRLPVVERSDPRRLVGYLGRAAIVEAHERRIDEESRRETGWFGTVGKPAEVKS
jgi:H+/Cl- antiporter ClcA/CBS domain-containing protein